MQRTFDLMAEEVPWPDQQFDRVTLAYLVLPMAALYTALRDRGRTEQDAVAAVTRALGVLLVRVERLMIGSLSRTRPGRRLLFEATSALSDALLAVTGPAWEATRVERSRNRMAVDVTRCYIVDTLRLLDAAPAAAALCANDTAAYEGVCPKCASPAPAAWAPEPIMALGGVGVRPPCGCPVGPWCRRVRGESRTYALRRPAVVGVSVSETACR